MKPDLRAKRGKKILSNQNGKEKGGLGHGGPGKRYLAGGVNRRGRKERGREEGMKIPV